MHWVLNFKKDKSPCRVNHATVSIGNFIFSFGGYCQHSVTNVKFKFRSPIDVHVLNTANFKWSKRPLPLEDDPQYLETPYFRYGHTCVVHDDLVYLWGGRSDWTNSLCDNLFSYDPKKHKWKLVEIDGENPEGRDGHTASVVKNSMYIFGGFVQSMKRFSNDIHEYDFLTKKWSLIVPKSSLRPFWRDFHTASVVHDNIYIFGGRMDTGRTRFTGENFYSNDLFCFNLNTRQWTELITDQSQISQNSSTNQVTKFSPCGRRSHTAVVHRNKIIIFGGYQENIQKHYNDLHEYDPEKNEWKVLIPRGIVPCQRRRHGCNIVNNQMIIFGGTGPTRHETVQSTQTLLRVEPIIENLAQDNLENNSYERLLESFERNLNFVRNLVRENNNLDFDVLNNALDASRVRLNNLRNIPIESLPVPQDEFDQIVGGQEDNDNNAVEVIEDEDIEFYDSDSDDLINEETDEEDDFNAGLASLSDLHVLDLEDLRSTA